jgi:hypothetical protein
MAEQDIAPPADSTAGEKPEATQRKRGRKKGTKVAGKKRSKFKDWIRVIKTQGCGTPNDKVHVVINRATNTLTLVTQGRKFKDGVDTDGNPNNEMEKEYRQHVRFTSYEVVNKPEPVEQPADTEPPVLEPAETN